MLIVNNLSVSYDKKKVLEGLDIEFQAGMIHGLVGLNGAGKTSFLNCLYGYKTKDSGIVQFMGAELKRKDMAYLETENYFYSNITGREYLSLFNSPESNFELDDWNAIFKLPLEQLIDSYSTGMKKKLALLAMLKQDRKIMILDEPFNGLDIESSKILSMILLRMKEKGRTVIVTSHILESLTSICDFIHYLNQKIICFSRDKEHFENLEHEIFREMKEEHSQLLDKVL